MVMGMVLRMLVLLTDRQMDKLIDIGDCRITFATENLSHLESIFLEL